jgi:hypothetical protein
VLQSLHPASPSGCPITLNWHGQFACPDPISDPVPIKFDGITNAHMRQPALARPVTNCFWMESQDFAQVLDIEQARLAFEFFRQGFWHAIKIAPIDHVGACMGSLVPTR